jgi:hypothetical protein
MFSDKKCIILRKNIIFLIEFMLWMSGKTAKDCYKVTKGY